MPDTNSYSLQLKWRVAPERLGHSLRRRAVRIRSRMQRGVIRRTVHVTRLLESLNLKSNPGRSAKITATCQGPMLRKDLPPHGPMGLGFRVSRSFGHRNPTKFASRRRRHPLSRLKILFLEDER